ncbi:major allergen I polypeptide chain 1-like [Phacochoerus africanus]|uniref:major allergen I polypeptide chain 1-like n=1 Tax=Phacochoerus africanus TaxID=41426 RepID=UPI001FDAB002|nr:major allergen I polypeptide chain 1-like [Phacochoerus africanus]
MKWTGVLLLLWAVLLLISEGNCDVCPKLKETIALFVAGDYEDYMAKVRENNSNPFIQDSLQKLKICMDRTLTQEDVQNVLNTMVKLYSSPGC